MWLCIQGIQVLAGVLLRRPVKVEPELLAGLDDALLGLLQPQVLLLDQLQLLLMLPLLLEPPAWHGPEGRWSQSLKLQADARERKGARAETME